MDQFMIAAHHEAGHVVMRSYHGLVTPSFVIYGDGTGMTASGGGLVVDLNVQLDVSLGGSVAEDLLLGRAQAPTTEEIEDSIDLLADGELENDWCGDLEQAISIVQGRRPDWRYGEIADAITSSYERCLSTLKRSWASVEQLAAEALQSPTGVVNQEAIERICNQ